MAPTQALLYLNSHMALSFETIFVHLRKEVLLSTKMATDITRRMVSSVYSPIFSQLDPLRLGETQRAASVAVQYGRRLIEESEFATESVLTRLVSGYPSHGFVIDLKEAQRLFGADKARAPEKEEAALEELFHQFLRSPVDRERKPLIVMYTEGGTTNEHSKKAGPPSPPAEQPAAAVAEAGSGTNGEGHGGEAPS
jgi:hypothetical protein